jgi:hypothetical protein
MFVLMGISEKNVLNFKKNLLDFKSIIQVQDEFLDKKTQFVIELVNLNLVLHYS